jgi:hypothetical protein
MRFPVILTFVFYMKKNGSRPKGANKEAPPASRPESAPVSGPVESFSEQVSRVDILILVLITLFGFAMRLYNIDFREANYDESVNMRVVRAPLFKEFYNSLLTVDCHPPISYLIQKLFYWFYPSIIAVRLASVLIGSLVIPALFWAFRPFLGRKVALAVSFVAATSYILVWYSRVARNYSLFFAVAVIMFGFFIRLMQRRISDRDYYRSLFGFFLSAFVAMYTHHTALLMFPIFAALYFAWELLHRQFRPRLLRHLVMGGLLIGFCAIPIMLQLEAWSFDHLSSERTRPTPSQLMDILASVGWGNGWRFVLWVLALLGGLFAVSRRSVPLAVVLGGWVIAPFAGYLLTVGMAPKFMWFFYRYAIFLQIGLVALVAACAVGLAERLDRFRFAGRRWFAFPVVIALLILVRLAVLYEPFTTFYRMKSSKHSREEIVSALRSVPYKRILGDNFYFVTGALREYKPADILISYPPVFNDSEEYDRFQVGAFVREACARDPLLGYFGTGARYYSQTNSTWEWMDHHFIRRKRLFNNEGYRLAELGLNYFTYLDKSSYFHFSLRYNTLEDLPEWYGRRGETLGAGYAAGWHPVSLFTQPAWKMWYCMERESSLFVYNGTASNTLATLSFEVQSCSATQHLVVAQDKRRIFDLALNTPPVILYALSGAPPVEAYVSFPKLIQDNEGIMPYFAGFAFPSGTAASLPFEAPPGLSFLRVRCSDGVGLMVSGLRIIREQPPVPAPAPTATATSPP